MQYEIEIKALLGSKQAADNLIKKVYQQDSSAKLVSAQTQLNHYFKGGDLSRLAGSMKDDLASEQLKSLELIATRANHINVRSRQKNDQVLLVVKGSLDDVSAAHSHQRMELEAEVGLTIDELDQKIISSGWQLEAKWQAERKIYSALGLNIDSFFTPGYGYLVEFEKVVTDDIKRDEAHQKVANVMGSLGVSELPNDRLERMFAYYNQHWQEYYGTDKVFVIE